MSGPGEVEDHVLKHYEIRRRIGKGAYGIVWKSVDRRTGEIVALKKIFDAFSNPTDAQRTYREVMFLQAFSAHDNVIQLLNVVRAANDLDLYLVFEFMDTDLHAVIKNRLLQPVHCQYIMYQLFRVMKYIHSGNCIHRDLKPSNVLINPQCHIKLADFGLARSLSLLEREGAGEDELGHPAMTDYVATRWYRSPEILLGCHLYTTGVDMWSLGCILAEMIAGKPLFPGTSTMNQIDRIMSVLPQPSRVEVERMGSPYALPLLSQVPRRRPVRLPSLLPRASEDALDLLNRLLQFSPERRLSAYSAVQHSYVKRFHVFSQEPMLDCDVVPHLDDNRQLTVEQYQDRLYHSIVEKRLQLKRGGRGGREEEEREEQATPTPHPPSSGRSSHTPKQKPTPLPTHPHQPTPPPTPPHQPTPPHHRSPLIHKASPVKPRPLSSTYLSQPSHAHLHPSQPPPAHLHPSQKAPDLTITSARIIPSARPSSNKPRAARGGPSRYASGTYTQTHGTISQANLHRLRHNKW